jgi:hypothetical protein
MIYIISFYVTLVNLIYTLNYYKLLYSKLLYIILPLRYPS